VMVAVTGDDEDNLVISLLSKQEFAVPRVIARVNHPKNHWLFNEAWGVDVAVSTPRLISALVEEAVTVGDLVRLLSFRHGEANLVEVTLPHDTEHAGQRVGSIAWPADVALVAILRDARVMVPSPDDPLEAGDELLFIASPDQEDALHDVLAARPVAAGSTEDSAVEGVVEN
jgi:trk system potassium uptake protein TrkA